MKKFLVVLLALAMVFAVATTAMAADTQIPDYSDTTTSTQYASDIYRLTALGVLCGDTGWGGAYRPTSNLTRAEFAKIAVYMYGKQDYVDYYKAQKSAFSDVPEGHWAEGYINCCNEFGLMVGVGGGKFAPNANVTKQEVATVTLRAVGYTDAGLPGEWPADFIAKSQKVHTWFEDDYKDELSLYQYVNKIDGTVATRAEMAAIVNYCLDLYRVEYVGSSKTVVYGIGGYVDNDGFAYKTADTNEPIGGYDTLLWDVFNAFVLPEWQFDRWAANGESQDRFVEASGWGFEDFAKCELVFSPNIGFFDDDVFQVNDNAVKRIAIFGNRYGLPVATDYYIYDQYLDGELWQLGNRYAFLTVQKNGSDYEALFAELLSDVNYVEGPEDIKIKGTTYDDLDNGDVFSGVEWKDDTNYDWYDYDWFKDTKFAIVAEVNKNEIVLDNYIAGSVSYKGDDIICIEDGCDVQLHKDQKIVVLKDGKLQDPTCLKVDDVVYCAGRLAVLTDKKDPAWLYIAYTPVAGSLDSLLTGIVDEDHRGAKISGDVYRYCNKNDAHQYSEGGYAADADYLTPLGFKVLEPYVGEDCLFVAGYGKLYIATLIFDAPAEANRAYGVVDDYKAEVLPPSLMTWWSTGLDFVGPDGANTGIIDLDEAVAIGADFYYMGDMVLGSLYNYYLNDDGEVILDDLGKVYGDDCGFVPFAPGSAKQVEVNKNGRFIYNSDLASLSRTVKSAEGMNITADTVVYEVTAKKTDSGNYVYDSVEVVKGDKYINTTFSARQLDIFAWDGQDVEVLYVVNPHFFGDILMGVFDASEYTSDGFVLTFEDGTELIYDGKDDPFYKRIQNGERYYAIYSMRDDVVDKAIYGSSEHPSSIKPGEMIVLFTKDGYGIDSASVEALLIANNDDATSCAGNVFWDKIRGNNDLIDETVYVDMTGDGGFDRAFFNADGSHNGDGAYAFYLVLNNSGEILQIFRFDADELDYPVQHWS